MSEPIFRYWDKFNEVYSTTSDRFQSISNFFHCYEKAKAAGNNPVLEQFTGRRDKGGNMLFAGDIIQVSYAYKRSDFEEEISFINSNSSNNLQPLEYQELTGHFIGVIRYQPSKGFVMSRVIEWVDMDDYTNHTSENEYKKKPGAMQFSASYATKIGNVNQHPELLKTGVHYGG